MVHRGRDCQLELQAGGQQLRVRPHPWFCRPGVVFEVGLEQEGLVLALLQRLGDHAGAVCQADRGLRPWQALGVTDGDMRVRG